MTSSIRLLLLPLAAAAVMPALVHAQGTVAVRAPHERLLPLQGGRNFRDLGGYRAADGRTVKWGLLFRSGSMHGLTDGDYRYLEGRGIAVVCDFRDRRERAAEPAVWPANRAPRVLSDDYDLDNAGFMPKGNPATWSEGEARSAMASSYPRMLVNFNGQYRRMFGELLAGHAPLAFNCSAGKDRTGIAAALILTALGVPRATVVQDYLLTNTYLDTKSLMAKSSATQASLASIPPQAIRAMMAADPSYIAAALDVVYGHKGGAEGYLHDELGLSHADLIQLRNLYLERAGH